MRITYLKLQGFKRFPLRDTELFEHEFNSKLTMISGPNGSGKSSLFNQLTPLPADKSFFNDQGYEELHITFRNKNYVLISDFKNKSPKYSFIVDGEELNTANIISTQRDLVYMHFGITSDIHDILTGVESFSNMSLGARKKLFKTITHINIDDVLKNYNDLKEEHKVQSLLLKTQLSNYKLEESKLLEEDKILELREKDKELKASIDFLLEVRRVLLSYKYTEVDDTIYTTLKEYDVKYSTYVKSRFLELTSENILAIPERKQKLLVDINVINSKLSDVYDELESNNKLLASLQNTTNVTEEQYLDAKVKLQDRINLKTSKLLVIKNNEVTEKTKLHILNAESTLIELLRTMLPNKDFDGSNIYTIDGYEKLLDVKNRILTETDTVKQQLLLAKADKAKSCDIHGDISCPSCSHSWPLRDAIYTDRNLDNEIQTLSSQLEELHKRYCNVEKTIQETQDYFTNYKKVTAFMNSTIDGLKFLWDIVKENDLISNNPSEIIRLINTLVMDLVIYNEIEEDKLTIEKINSKLEEITKNKLYDIQGITDRIAKLNTLAANLQDQRHYNNYRLNIYTKAEEYHKTYKDYKQSLEFYRKEARSNNLNKLIELIVKDIEDKIREVKISSVEIESTLQNINTIEATLAKYREDIEDTESNVRVLNYILEELSPKNGLIAKSISSFLNTIIHNVNDTISKIWSYKMVLVPIDVENDSLNYKFRVDIEDKLSIGDINLASKGMKECIDLAFKLVLYKLLKLENYPLYLDELASHMDSEHSANITNLVGSLAGSDRFSQLFIITHKENFGFLREVDNIQLG